MTMKIIVQVLLVCTIMMHGEILANDSIFVYLTIEGFKNEDGVCRMLLFESEKGFPDSPEYAILMLSQNIRGKTAEFNFKVRPGKYAISILHDKNADGKMDKTWYGKPTEGFGASNNPKIQFGPPKFEESAIVINDSNNFLKIKLNYL